ncbi:cytochrome c oxidase assembly protein [Macrococcus hajekii]|nr:cytochrome c oxidase assembly protein [Macrococcus hajekii]
MDIVIVLIVVLLIVAYLYAALRQTQEWSLFKIVSWIAGMLCGLVVMVGPLAEQMHHHFVAHMYGHLLLGMLAPLLLVLATPITLLFRTLPAQQGRRISKLLGSRYVRLVTHPVVALILNTGGLWLLYRTDLFMLMHHYPVLHYLIHFHIFMAGYLLTSVMLEIEPTRHPYSFKYRSIVMIVSIALHQILSKSFYPYPPAGVSTEQSQQGAMVMYYGGDIIELVIIYMMCLSWYRAVRPRRKKDDIQLNII